MKNKILSLRTAQYHKLILENLSTICKIYVEITRICYKTRKKIEFFKLQGNSNSFIKCENTSVDPNSAMILVPVVRTAGDPLGT